jgi:hypothetical protein
LEDSLPLSLFYRRSGFGAKRIVILPAGTWPSVPRNLKWHRLFQQLQSFGTENRIQ